jgi:hypothetical protein
MELKTVIVLGMHRSATSLVAKGLHDAGVAMGDDLLQGHSSNPWGHFEDIEFIALNDAILRAAGGSWDNPPPEEAILDQASRYEASIKALVAANDGNVDPDYPIWGWKDPRTTLTIRLFVRYLTRPHFIACFRNPWDVAASLEKRDGMSIDKGVALAREYNRRMINFLSELGGIK